MSEEILKALMELFALVVKQDGGILARERNYVADFLEKQLTRETVHEYLALFDQHAGPVIERSKTQTSAAPSVKDSVKILGICKKINRTLNQEQKVVVLMRLYELVNADNQYTVQRMNILNTVAEVFRISPDEFAAVEQFVKYDKESDFENDLMLILSPDSKENPLSKKMQTGYTDSRIIILRIPSVDLYFFRYISEDQFYLNGLPVRSGIVYTFAKGGSIKSTQGHAIYYSDISSYFLSDFNIHKISFTAENISFYFREGHPAVDDVSFSVSEGKLIGILGSSGSGKTTLLNIISGIQKPASGTITINGLDLFRDRKQLEGVFGFVPQDDLLIEDLTVFENLYFAACQCFSGKKKEEITKIVDRTLSNLGLLEKRDLKVGSPLNKVISGGQRKRLNIALELIREPMIMFIDEPTSGLSSRDSEILMDIIRDLTLKGKLIFTVIHQPSSEIFKMFDKVLILDREGCQAYFGNPVDSVIYFKTLDSQINSQLGECPSCGNVTPESIFNILETQVVDEFGKYTEKRKVKPAEWAAIFKSRFPFSKIPDVKERPHQILQRPGKPQQYLIYLLRDLKGKLANKQYILLTLLEAPVLAFVLSFIIRYIPDPDSNIYIFADNENIPIYIFMSLIVALFLGLTVSAEEIFRDRKILKRERFLNLSRTSYLLAKISVLILISALQTITFVLIANSILDIKGMYINYWLALFTTAFCANMIGLNISASFNSAITIYIVIPLLIIPMMVLSGAMFPFDKLNRTIGNVENVPMIAEIMPTRWTYEALIVTQFKDNRYSNVVYDREGNTYYMLKKKISQAEFNKVQRIPALREALRTSVIEYRGNPKTFNQQEDLLLKKSPRQFSKLDLIKHEISKLSYVSGIPFLQFSALNPDEFNPVVADSLSIYLDRLDRFFRKISNTASDQIDRFYNMHDTKLKDLEDGYYNYRLEEIVTKPYERKKILLYNNSIVQNTDPVYMDPDEKGLMNFRTHFFSPSKYIFGMKTDTFVFNITLVLLSTILLYFILYYELLGKAVRFFENLKLPKINI